MQWHDNPTLALLETHAEPETVASDLILARQAQPGWAAQSVRQRLRIIRRVRHLVAEQALSLAQTVARVTQRSPAETLVAEILPLADACRFLEREAAHLLKPQRLSAWSRPFWLTGIKAEIHREPLGVVLLIAPSNYPLFLAGVQLLQALTAGNAVLLKPGDGTSAAAVALTRMCSAAGLDPRLLRVLSEPPASVQEAIAAGVDKVVLTATFFGARSDPSGTPWIYNRPFNCRCCPISSACGRDRRWRRQFAPM